MMSPTQIYTLVTKRLIEQNARASQPDGRCNYYIPETGHKCAVGVLISPENYTPRIETSVVRSCMSKDSPLYKVLEVEKIVDPLDERYSVINLTLLAALQRAHDTASTVPEMLYNLHKVGIFFDLDIPEELYFAVKANK